MSFRFYKAMVQVFYFLFVVVFLTNIYIDRIDWLNHTLARTACFYAPPILSLLFLYFGVYAYISKMKPVKIFGGPTTCIIFASIFILSSFVPLLSQYFYYTRLPVSSISSIDLRELKQRSLDPARYSLGKSEAQLYYMETGEQVEYVDKSGIRMLSSIWPG